MPTGDSPVKDGQVFFIFLALAAILSSEAELAGDGNNLGWL
jgi:hypothetical protein